MSATANRLHTLNLMPGLLTAAERDEHRLYRLRELRATIESLRQEQTRDPLLAWVLRGPAESAGELAGPGD